MLLSLSVCFLGFMFIALSMPKHYEQIRGHKGRLPQSSLWAGYILLLASIYPCIAYAGISIGLSLWLALVTVTAFIIMFLLSYKSYVVVPLSITLCLLSSALLIQ